MTSLKGKNRYEVNLEFVQRDDFFLTRVVISPSVVLTTFSPSLPTVTS